MRRLLSSPRTLPSATAAFAVLLLALLAAVFYSPILLGIRSFPDGDFTHHFLPFSLFQQQELLAGRLPIWNPYTYGGHPFLADVQAAVFYPISNLVLGLTLPFHDAGVRMYFLEVEAVVQVVMAGFFTYFLVRDLTGSRWAALFAGAIFSFSGYLTGYPPLQLAVLRTAIWLPLILWLLLRMARPPHQWRWCIGAGVALAVSFLAGHSQTFLYVVYVTAAWMVVLVGAVWRENRAEKLTIVNSQWSIVNEDGGKRDGRGVGVVIGQFVLVGLIAIGLSAAQWLPSIEFVAQSVRANVDYAFVSGGFPLQDTWQMLLPGVLTQFSPIYIGVVGLGMVVLAIGAWPGASSVVAGAPSVLKARWGILFFAGMSLLALLLSYGANGFLYPVFYRFAPGWNLFRGQERAAYAVTLGLCILAGYGAAAIPTMALRLRARLATLYIVLVAVGVYVFGLMWQLPGRTAIGQGQFLVAATITLVLAGAVTVMLRWPGWSKRRTVALFLLAVGNLFWANMATNVADFSPARKTVLAPEVEALQQAVVTTHNATGLPGRTYNEYRAYEDFGVRTSVEDVWGSSPLRLARYAALFDNFPLDRMWRLLGVDHVLTWRKELFAPSNLLGEWPQATDTTYLHALPGGNPRAWVVQQVEPDTDKDAIQLLADSALDLNKIAIVADSDWPTGQSVQTATSEMRTGETGTGETGTAAPPKVELIQSAPGKLIVQVSSDTGGLIVFAENWLPGWTVEDIQCPAEDPACASRTWQSTGLSYFKPVRANLTLVGVPIPPGKLQFNLTYQPSSIKFGLLISAVTLVLLAVAGLLSLRRWRSNLQATQP